MSGKPSIPLRVHAKIRVLAKNGMGKREIAETVGHSLYTVRKALDPGFAEQERARHRAMGADRWNARKNDADYAAYQAEYGATDQRREQVRINMASLRSRRKANSGD